MANLSAATDAMMSTDMYREAAFVLGGMAGAIVVRNLVDPRFDLPDEIYGLAVGGGAAAMDRPMMAAGGFGYTLVQLAERFGVKSTVENAGA